MIEVIECPQCRRKLRLPDDALGQPVQCIGCGTTFTPPGPPAPLSAPTPVAAKPLWPDRPEDRPPPLPQPPALGLGGDGPLIGGRQPLPHRAGLVLTLGIASILLSMCPIFGVLLGGLALSLGTEDIDRMKSNVMDSSGRTMTGLGRALGGIAMAIGVLSCLLQLGMWRR